uniref:Uncharacterized protein n=1 Tax=Anopheles coluzzii TaxID=1518534 RepID=A0A8W7PR47_ANOCL
MSEGKAEYASYAEGETSYRETSPMVEIENVAIDPSGASFILGTLPDAAIPSEVDTPGRYIPVSGKLMPYEWVQSKAGTSHRFKFTTSEVVTLRSIPEAGNARPRKQVQSKAGELHGYETQRSRVGTEGTRSAHEGRRYKKYKLQRMLRTLNDEDVKNGLTATTQHTDCDTPVKLEKDFTIWSRGVELSMMKCTTRKDGPSRTGGHDLHNYNTHTSKDCATQHVQTLYSIYLTHIQYLSNATHSRLMLHIGYATNSKISIRLMYMVSLRKKEHYEHATRTSENTQQPTEHLKDTKHSGFQIQPSQTASIAEDDGTMAYLDWMRTRKALAKC